MDKLKEECGILGICSPQTYDIAPCHYGTDVPDTSRLIAAEKDHEEIRAYIGCDSLGFFRLDRLGDMIGCHGREEREMLECSSGDEQEQNFCCGCFTGDYPAGAPEHTGKYRFEIRLPDHGTEDA